MKKILAISLIVSSFNAIAQYPKVDIPGSEVRKLSSSIGNGQEYELQILLPGEYKTSDKKYPVAYLMDSQWDFPLVKSLYGQYYYDGFIPELIIVGVTWGGINPNPDSLRARDYTPTREPGLPQSGGADNFLAFMKNELFPFIESNYRADHTNRALMGCSLGGLFTLYTLFTQPDLFSFYAAASPAIEWDRAALYRFEKKFAEKKMTTPLRVYMTIGDVERSRPAYEKFVAEMKSRKYTSVGIVSKILWNTGHSGTKGETYSRGLQYFFERPKLNLSSALLEKYKGIYQTANGNTIEIKHEKGRLALYFSANNKYYLYAASETDFYSDSEYFTISFKNESGKTGGFQLNRFNNSQFIRKTN